MFIKPNLERGRIVVSDRYVFSSLAYQGAAGMDLEWIREINRAAIDPDLAIYIDVPIDVIMRRFRGRGSVMERREIQEKVRRIYMHLVRRGELIMVNGNRPIAETSREIRRIVSERLNLKCP